VLASGATDATIILWDVETRLPLEPLRGHKYEVLAVAFSPDGRTLVSGDKNGDMFFWDVDPQLWQGKLCAKLTRKLSQSEWDTYVGKNYPYQKSASIAQIEQLNERAWDARSGPINAPGS
jgi:WD40 repeat protein